MSHYYLEAKGSRGEVTRTGSQRSGLVAKLHGPGQLISAELFHGWMGDNLRLYHNTQLLYEGALSDLDAYFVPHSQYRPICKSVSSLRQALRMYAEGRDDQGAYARQILGRTANAQPRR